MLLNDGTLDAELNVKKGRAYGSLTKLRSCGDRSIFYSTEVKCYRAYELPILLFGSETWALKEEQSAYARAGCTQGVLDASLGSSLFIGTPMHIA